MFTDDDRWDGGWEDQPDKHSAATQARRDRTAEYRRQLGEVEGYHHFEDEDPGGWGLQSRARLGQMAGREVDFAREGLRDAMAGTTQGQAQLQAGSEAAQRAAVTGAMRRGASPAAQRSAAYAGGETRAGIAGESAKLRAAESGQAYQQYVQSMGREAQIESQMQEMEMMRRGQDRKAARDEADRAAAQEAAEDALVQQYLGASLSVISDEQLKVGMTSPDPREIEELRERVRKRDSETFLRQKLINNRDAPGGREYAHRALAEYERLRDETPADREAESLEQELSDAGYQEYEQWRDTGRRGTPPAASRFGLGDPGGGASPPPDTNIDELLRGALRNNRGLAEQRLGMGPGLGPESRNDEKAREDAYDNLLGAGARSYRYKSGMGLPEGPRLGPTAQDLEASGPEGKALVSPGPAGYKEVDTGGLSLTNFGGLSKHDGEIKDLQEQLNRLDREKGWGDSEAQPREMSQDELRSLLNQRKP